eukprot:TRINITY_DN95489_c0_g1_i1.p1 TRINITY_DN95489_c0_g1~~TRINITY_DN95489_c0_g1_i1.p1  ORF type:complete len:206 (-),score=34.94 TRINITY_DN95489_c0_g1_i1:21-638(-)
MSSWGGASTFSPRMSQTAGGSEDQRALLRSVAQNKSLPDLMRQEGMCRMRMQAKLEAMTKLHQDMSREQSGLVKTKKKDELIRRANARPIGLRPPSRTTPFYGRSAGSDHRQEAAEQRLQEVEDLEKLVAAIQKRKEQLRTLERQSSSLVPLQAIGCGKRRSVKSLQEWKSQYGEPTTFTPWHEWRSSSRQVQRVLKDGKKGMLD